MATESLRVWMVVRQVLSKNKVGDLVTWSRTALKYPAGRIVKHEKIYEILAYLRATLEA